ncbi:UNKNOWN [Stylonychia lemnae]|uniref:Nuclear speckle splicing regulatory protein 1 N-terminal domain-containing protein n=1 Tax=Stylonychia lemnae TaxID=5949 RepID=A0A078B1A7_STYLE|nr:UNKNOWN [Stylonychia lemnae]|eukprot:CDW88111.1 UNKNOWN [Stylonychia lemnae]
MEFSFMSNQDEQLKKHGITSRPNLSKPIMPNTNQAKQNPLASLPKQAGAQPISVFQQKPMSIFQKNNKQQKTDEDEDEDQFYGIQSLLKQNQQRYQQKLAEESSKVIAQNPLAYEYDALYDEEQERREQQLAMKKESRKNLESKYQKELLLAAERRKREQNAAWEKMEQKERINEVNSGKVGPNAESFITESYRRQMELNQQNKLYEELEEQLNQKKTANSETGMMGFYKVLNRTMDTVNNQNKQIEQEQKSQKQIAQDKVGEHLKILKEKQLEQERLEKERRSNELYDDDPFQIKKAEKTKADKEKAQELERQRRRSRSRELKEKKLTEKRLEEEKKLKDKQEKEAKLLALKSRYNQRRNEVQQKPMDTDKQSE